MTIDTRGQWWKGTEYADIVAFLGELKPGGYSVDRVIRAVCQCGGETFSLLIDADEELAKTTCAACGRDAFVSDSEDHWGDGSPVVLKCPCGHAEYEVALGLCVREETWVRWMSLGARCVRCGILGSPLDWKSDLELTDPVATRIG